MTLFKRLKLDLFYIRKAFFENKAGWRYIYNRYIAAKRILRGKRVLEKPINCDNLSIHCLTCHYDLVSLIWALFSFYSQCQIYGELFIHNDGTLTKADVSTIKKFFPSCRVIFPNDERLKSAVKIKNYSSISDFRAARTEYILLKKLIDPFLVSDKQTHLIIDSDLLWFKAPVELQDEIARGGENSLMMVINRRECPVYFHDKTVLRRDLALYNSGIVFYNEKNFNLARLAEYLEKIDKNDERNIHFIEQAGYAYCLDKLKSLPEDKYPAVGHLYDYNTVNHFTGPNRTLFYIEGLEKLKNTLVYA